MTTRETMLAAYRMFAVWRRDILAAGFDASGAPLLVEWSASDSTVREACAATLAAVQAEITNLTA